MFVYTAISWLRELAVGNCKWCVSTSARRATLTLSCFWCGDGIVGRVSGGSLKGCGLWRCAATLCGWEHTTVSSATQIAALTVLEWVGPTPWPRDTVVQRRLPAEPRTPFIHQMYFEDLVPQRLQSPTWLFLIVWLFSAAVFFPLFLRGKDIIVQPHLFNCGNWSHSNWALPFICNGNDYEIAFVLSSLVWWVRVEWHDGFSWDFICFLEYCT